MLYYIFSRVISVVVSYPAFVEFPRPQRIIWFSYVLDLVEHTQKMRI